MSCFLEPPTIADFKDLLVDPNVLDNVTLNCSFTGYPIPAVYWMRVLEGFTYQYFNDSTVITGNTAVLSLSNALKHLGSYQCVAVNEAGYVSRTARVLPKGKYSIITKCSVKLCNMLYNLTEYLVAS